MSVMKNFKNHNSSMDDSFSMDYNMTRGMSKDSKLKSHQPELKNSKNSQLLNDPTNMRYSQRDFADIRPRTEDKTAFPRLKDSRIAGRNMNHKLYFVSSPLKIKFRKPHLHLAKLDSSAYQSILRQYSDVCESFTVSFSRVYGAWF